MLIEFKFRNFKSFKDEISFLMTDIKAFKEHINSNIIEIPNREFNILKTGAIYGMNGAGKSNFINAMSFMTGIIHNSFSLSLKKEEDRPSHNFCFKLNTETEKSSTMFEVSFLLDDVIYRYGFEIKGYKIEKEWLYKKIDRENELFYREKNVFRINSKSFAEGDKFKDEVNDNVLFLSHLAQYNQPVSKDVLFWINEVNSIDALTDNHYEKFTANLMKDDINFKKWSSLALKYLEISNIEPSEEKGEIVTYHNKYDKDNILIGSVPFNVTSDESAGTRKLIFLLGPIYDTLREGRILFIDELDSKLHPNLTRKLVELFNNFNNTGAQLIFTAQDTTLMDKDLFRRDQIWFIDKNQFGSSEIYSLSEFNSKVVRKDSAFDKRYLENKFGSAETININKELTTLLYAE